MKSTKFLELGEQAGFSRDMAMFLLEYVSQKPHTHTSEQITDFAEAVVEAVEADQFEEEVEEEEE